MRDENQQLALSGAPVDVVPNFSTKLTKLNLFAKYELKKNVDVRLNYVYDRFHSDDWTWTTWMYSDGTQVMQNPKQTVQFIGVMMSYRFQ
jgi:predicted porin